MSGFQPCRRPPPEATCPVPALVPRRPLSAHPARHLPGAQTHGGHRGAVDRSASAPPLALLRPRPLAPRPPAKHTTFRREQTSDRQAHRQTHRHSPAATPRETASRRQLLSQSHGTRERPGPDERTGGRLSGETEAERDEASETDCKTARGRCRQTDRQTRHATPRTHTFECGPWRCFCS